MATLLTDKFLIALNPTLLVGMTDAQKEMRLFVCWVENQGLCTIQSIGVKGNDVSVVTELDHHPRMADDLQSSLNAWLRLAG